MGEGRRDEVTEHLWVDVPTDKRVTPEFLRTRQGAVDADWLARQIAILDHPGCEIAVRWSSADLWHPCKQPVAAGAQRCHKHGGPKRPPSYTPMSLEEKRRRTGARAAALDLLAACELALKVVDDSWTAHEVLKAAIRKAKGGRGE